MVNSITGILSFEFADPGSRRCFLKVSSIFASRSPSIAISIQGYHRLVHD